MYEHVLVPTDGSDDTEAAVDHAVDLAARYGATLHALSVIDTSAGLESADVAIFDAYDEVAREAVEAVTDRAATAGSIDTRESVMRGVPHRAILDYVDDHDIDLIVMGTHGRTGLDRYLLGSTAEKVVRLAEVPVLTVKLPEE